MNATVGYGPTFHGVGVIFERTKILTVSLIDILSISLTYWLIVTSRACCLHHVANVCMKNKGMMLYAW